MRIRIESNLVKWRKMKGYEFNVHTCSITGIALHLSKRFTVPMHDITTALRKNKIRAVVL